MNTFLLSLIILTNSERATPLTVDRELSHIASIRAAYLCKNHQWSHDGWLDSFKGVEGVFGENLARGFDDATSTNDALMASPTHRENITNPRFTTIGVGKKCGITVELFKS